LPDGLFAYQKSHFWYIWRATQREKTFVHYMAIWYILFPFGMFYFRLVYFISIWYTFSIWYILFPFGIFIMQSFGIPILWFCSIFCGHLVYLFCGFVVYFVVIWYTYFVVL
jgi:hypothetical protein